jgi:hypothetical protein
MLLRSLVGLEPNEFTMSCLFAQKLRLHFTDVHDNTICRLQASMVLCIAHAANYLPRGAYGYVLEITSTSKRARAL